MYQASNQAAKKIEDKISKMAQPVLYVISKDIEEPHIPKDVKKTAVQKHRGKKRKDLLKGCKLRRDIGIGVSHGNNSEEKEGLFQTRTLKELPQEYKDIETDNKRIDNWEIL
jgi:hypothetical protein